MCDPHFTTQGLEKFQNRNCLSAAAAAANQTKIVNTPWSQFQYRTAQMSEGVVSKEKTVPGFTMSWIQYGRSIF